MDRRVKCELCYLIPVSTTETAVDGGADSWGGEATEGQGTPSWGGGHRQSRVVCGLQVSGKKRRHKIL